MRLATLSDVHGNAFALEAVLADIKSASPDALYNLGDTVWGGVDPARAWALQREHAPPTVRGNTDEYLLTDSADLKEETRAYRAFVEGQLGGVPPELAALPVSATVADGAVLLAHGSPRDPWEDLLLTGKGAHTRAATHAEVRERLGNTSAQVVVVGHTHHEMLDAQGGLTVVNAGPVSRQRDGQSAARWVLLEERGGVWNVQFRRVPYDVEAAARWAEAHAPDGDKEARQLREGKPG